MASRYGKDGYFFIFDAQLNYIGHPLKPALDGTSVYKLKDAKGRNLGELFAKAVADGSGLASYDWIKPGDSDETEKISKVLRSQRWHWVVGTGQHIEDINREIWQSAINLLVIMGLGTLLLLLAGMAIAEKPLREVFCTRRNYLPTVLRLVVCPLVVLVLLWVCHASSWVADGKNILMTVYLAAITPACATVTSMAQLYDRDAAHSSALYVLTTLLSIVSMPVMIGLFDLLL
jgi:hypothetical protein